MLNLLDLNCDRATLVIAHRLVGLASADEISVLDDVHVVERGREDELLRRRGLHHHLW